jgi:hypothetical protein
LFYNNQAIKTAMSTTPAMIRITFIFSDPPQIRLA